MQVSKRVVFVTPPTIYDRNGGGMQTQVYRTKEELEQLGYEIEFYTAHKHYDAKQYLCAHAFCAGASTYFPTLSLAKQGLPIVLSTVFIRGSASRLSDIAYRYGHDLIERLPWKLLDDTICARKQAAMAKAALPNTRFEQLHCESVLRLASSKCRVIPNGIDTDWLDLPKDKDAEPSTIAGGIQQPFVLCVGRINDRRKHFPLVAEVCIELGMRCVLVGNWDATIRTSESQRLQHLIDTRSDLIHYVGPLPYRSRELSEMYNRCHVFALPSDFETPGLAALEAGYCRANVIITNVGGTEDYFGSNAIYVSPGNKQQLRAAMEQAVNAPKNEELRERVGSSYKWKNVAELTAAAYSDFIVS
ncbi:MAG: glycosyltransferase family 4 protein [Pirellulaceae bacterium]|nr:glycosyltransferase family 4 protein [Planctomycetales bacterium]